MIKYYQISNFKSLVDFRIRQPKFAVLIGLNGAGKTTILQAFDFLSQMMNGRMDEWLILRGWDKTDIASKLVSLSNVNFSVVTGETNKYAELWQGSFNRKELACLTEDVGSWKSRDIKEHIFRLRDRQYRIADRNFVPVAFSYQGSILSQLRDSELSPELKNVRDTLRNIRSLELLSPHLMRQRTRDSAADIGIGGEKLSAYLHSIKGGDKQHLLELLRTFYPV